MSVINQMLMDLERRRASSAERNRIPAHVRALPGNTPEVSSRMPIVVAAVAVVIALAVGGWWFAQRNRGAVQPVQPAVPAAKPAVPKAPVEPESVEMIAQRMSFELSNISELPLQQASVPSTGVTTAAIVGREERAGAPERTAPPAPAPAPAAQRSAPAKAVAAAGKPEPSPRVEISKQVRELTPRQRADAEYARGVAALHQGRSGDARAAFEATLAILPTHHAARQALVGTMLDVRQFVEAAKVLQEGLNLAPSQYGFAMALARLQIEQGELDAAVQTLGRSADHAGGSAEYAAFYAGLLQRQQKHVEAVEMFERALRQRGNSGVWLLGLGLSLDALGRGPEAQEAYRRAKSTGNLPGDLAAFVDQRLR